MPRLRVELGERAICMLEAGMAARAVARRLNVHESTISRLRSRYQETNSTRDRARTGRPRVTPAQDNHIRLRHLRNRQLTAASTARVTSKPTTPEFVSTQCVDVCGRLGFVVVGRTLAWCSRMTEDFVACNGDSIIVIGPSTIDRRFFSRTNPGSVCHELMGEHVFGVVLENVIRMLL